ncbi:class I SAM-dependent methyltransferase [Micromonospora orduensis]|uniref:Class I SAM-dependent methyltransferase n=1 Tax=Micromonospora orduensis TaxID=1420891 RepID=A0A5C4QCN5_9ACTN|nr:class I SAM-dependent methyltransferase [Micromonospora orduensis]
MFRHRSAKLAVTVEPSDDFMRTPRPAQRAWWLQRAGEELVDDLTHLDELGTALVTGSDRPEITGGWQDSDAHYAADELIIEGQQVMQDWEAPLMRAMAAKVAATGGDILEIGFGMGISATYMLDAGIRSYTVLEANEDVAQAFAGWRKGFPGTDTKLIPGPWQETLPTLGLYDGIFFDTYPADENEYREYVVEDVTFAAHFFPHAAAHLRPGGVFSYYSNEIDSLSRRHQRRLLEHFSGFSVEVVRGLVPPDDCNYWWSSSMAVVQAIK